MHARVGFLLGVREGVALSPGLATVFCYIAKAINKSTSADALGENFFPTIAPTWATLTFRWGVAATGVVVESLRTTGSASAPPAEPLRVTD
jgi:hypothetical protein